MMLAGVSVRNELVQRLGYLVGDSELAGKIERGLDAQQAILPLTASEREAILVALDEVPDGLRSSATDSAISNGGAQRGASAKARDESAWISGARFVLQGAARRG